MSSEFVPLEDVDENVVKFRLKSPIFEMTAIDSLEGVAQIQRERQENRETPTPNKMEPTLLRQKT